MAEGGGGGPLYSVFMYCTFEILMEHFLHVITLMNKDTHCMQYFHLYINAIALATCECITFSSKKRHTCECISVIKKNNGTYKASSVKSLII